MSFEDIDTTDLLIDITPILWIFNLSFAQYVLILWTVDPLLAPPGPDRALAATAIMVVLLVGNGLTLRLAGWLTADPRPAAGS